MIEKLIHFDANRFIQRYLNTYGWLITKDKKQLVQISDIVSTRIEFKDSVGNTFFVYTNSGVEFEFLPVKRGFTVGAFNNVYYLERVAARQYQRGICANNTRIYDVSAGWITRPISGEILDSIYNHSAEFFYDKHRACALSRAFAIDKANVVACYSQRIGVLDKDDNIKLDTNLFRQELIDVITRKNYPLTVQ